jgi:predicted component of type VI protein secretion system
MMKEQNFVYDEMHVFVFALSKYDSVHYDYNDALDKDYVDRRSAIIQSMPKDKHR